MIYNEANFLYFKFARIFLFDRKLHTHLVSLEPTILPSTSYLQKEEVSAKLELIGSRFARIGHACGSWII